MYLERAHPAFLTTLVVLDNSGAMAFIFAQIKRYCQFCSQAYMFDLNSIYNLCLFVYDCHMLLESLGQGYPSNPI